jgi:tetratricopeptide (TPR) repeat protein
MRRLVALLLAVGVPAIALVPALALGQPRPKPAPAAASGSEKTERYDPDNITGISQYMEAIAKGNQLFTSKDTTGAIDAYRRAIQLSPKNPLAHYLVAEAQIVAGNIGEAEAAIAEASQNTDLRNPQLRARVLFVVADVFERQKKWDQAKTAWQAYAEHAARFGGDGGMFPQSAAERLKAVQKALELEKAYAPVRERIAAEKKGDAGKR